MQPDKLKQLTTQYLEAVSGEWKNLSVGEKRIPLAEVYVMLQAVENRPPRPQEFRSASGLKDNQQEQSTLENGATGRPDGSGRTNSEREQPPLPLANILAENKHLVLLGEPGAGKSTALRFIGLCFAHEGWAREKLEIDDACVPVLLVLREYAETLSGAGPCLEKTLAQAVNKRLRLTEAEAESLVAAWQGDDHLLVLLDGLDEVPDHLRSNVAKEIRLYAGSENGKKCRIVLSSRQAGYIAQSSDFRTFILKPFQHPEDALPFLRKWLAVQPNWDKDRVESESDKLLAEITGRPALRRYIDNPLLLRLAVETFASHGAVASNRGKMYEDYISKTIWEDVYTLAQRSIALDAMEDLAWQLQYTKAIDASKKLRKGTEKVITDPPNLSLLVEKLRIVEVEAGKLSFSHDTFQEYFVARRLKKAWQEKESRKRAWIMLRSRLHDPNWREPLLLLAGMLYIDDAVDLVSKVLNAHSRYERDLFRDLRLAAELLGERSDVNSKLKLVRKVINRLKKRLLKFSILSENDEGARWKASKALSAIGTPVIPALKPLFYNYYLSDFIDDPRELLRPWDSPAHVSLKTAGFQIWAGDKLKRLAEKISGPIIGFSDKVYMFERRVQEGYFRVIAQIGMPALSVLEDMMSASRTKVRFRAYQNAIMIYENNGHESVPALIDLTKHSDQLVRQNAIDALIRMGEKQVLPLLVQLVIEGKKSIYLFEIFGSLAIPALEQVYEYRNGWGYEISSVLYRINDARIIPLLLRIYLGNSWFYGSRAQEAIEKFGQQATIHLLNALREIPDDDVDKREVIIIELDKIGDPRAIPYLSNLLHREKNIKIRRLIILALGNIGTEKIFHPLLNALLTTPLERSSPESIEQLRLIGEAISKVGPSVIPELTNELHHLTRKILTILTRWKKLSDEKKASHIVWRCNRIRLCIVETLRKIGDQRSIPILLQMFGGIARELSELTSCYSDDDWTVTYYAQRAKKLNQVISETLGNDLPNQCNDLSFQVSRGVALDIIYDQWYLLDEIVGALGDSQDDRCVPALCTEVPRTINYDFGYNNALVEALGKIGNPDAVPCLSARMQEVEEVYDRFLIAIALIKCGDTSAIPVLCECLPRAYSHNDKNMLEAIKLLGESKTQEAESTLRKLIHTSEIKYYNDWWAAVEPLAKMNDQEALEILTDELRDFPYPAIAILKRLGLVGSLLHITNEGYLSSEAIQAVEEMGITALSVLIRALEDSERLVRLTAVQLLEKLGLPALNGLIVALSNPDSRVRGEAAEALLKINDPRAKSALINGLRDPEPTIRRTCAVALCKLGDQRALPVISKEWQISEWQTPEWQPSSYYDSDVKEVIIKTIGDLGDEKYIPLLFRVGFREDGFSLALDNMIDRMVDRTKIIAYLRRWIRKVRRFKYMYTLETLVNRQDIIRAPKISDPLLPAPPPSTRRRWLARFGLGVLLATLIVIAGGVMLLTDMLRDVLKGQWQLKLQTWAIAHPVELLLLASTVILLGGLLAWGIDAIKDYIRKH